MFSPSFMCAKTRDGRSSLLQTRRLLLGPHQAHVREFGNEVASGPVRS